MGYFQPRHWEYWLGGLTFLRLGVRPDNVYLYMIRWRKRGQNRVRVLRVYEIDKRGSLPALSAAYDHYRDIVDREITVDDIKLKRI